MTLAIKGSPGYSLVEFLIAMLILALVSLSWLTIVQVQSANRESYRREAVERLAGMMDVISQMGSQKNVFKINTAWTFGADGILTTIGSLSVASFEPPLSTLGYRLRIKRAGDLNGELISDTEESGSERNILKNSSRSLNQSPVLVGELFEQAGVMEQEVYTDNEKNNVGERIWRVAVVLRRD